MHEENMSWTMKVITDLARVVHVPEHREESCSSERSKAMQEMVIHFIEIGKPNECTTVLVINQVLLDIHLIQEGDHQLFPLLAHHHFCSYRQLKVNLLGETWLCFNSMTVISKGSLRRKPDTT